MHNLTKNSRAVGRAVILEIINEGNWEGKDMGGIILPETFDPNTENKKLIKGKVVSVGAKAAAARLTVGDVVSFDKWSIFGENGKATEKPGELVILNFDTGIVAIDRDEPK